MSFGAPRCLTVHEHPAGRRSPGRRRARVPRPGRALPPRARGPLLPHARLASTTPRTSARTRCCAPGARFERFERPLVGGDVAVPDRHQRLPGRAREAPAPEPSSPTPTRASRTPTPSIADPAARYALREGMELAFLTAIQRLPGRQRAVLILRDVLGWTGAETAELLDTTVTAVNSALQRARATIEAEAPARAVAPGRRDAARAAAPLRRRVGARGHRRAGRAAARGRGADDAARAGARRRGGDRRVPRPAAAAPGLARRRPGSTATPRSSSASAPRTGRRARTGCSSSTSAATASPACAPTATHRCWPRSASERRSR